MWKIAIVALSGLVCVGTAQAATLAAMRGQRRVLIVAAPSPADERLAAQTATLRAWQAGAADRDITLVRIVGDRLTGADDRAPALRKRYRLATGAFAVVLIGKDGHEAFRADKPVPADRLEATIDAMPMRRAGIR